MTEEPAPKMSAEEFLYGDYSNAPTPATSLGSIARGLCAWPFLWIWRKFTDPIVLIVRLVRR